MSYKGLLCLARETLSPTSTRLLLSKTTNSPGPAGFDSLGKMKLSSAKFPNLFPNVKSNSILDHVKNMLTLSKKEVVANLKSQSSAFRQKACVIYVKVDEKLCVLSLLFVKQCNQILALRIRRAAQIGTLYSKLGYDKETLATLIQKLGLSFLRQVHRVRSGKPLACLFATVGVFNWDEKKIQEQELAETAGEISLIHEASKESKEMNVDGESTMLYGWEKVLSRDNLLIYKKPIPESTHLCEYKVFGTFKDIPARAFFNAQLDLDYRKQWDKYVIKLEVVDRDTSSGTEVVQWITHFPYPMYQREYVYLRRTKIDQRKKVMVIVSRHTDHPTCPHNNKFVRVDNYVSKMVIKPHGNSFDENGFDYILTYHDDPKSSIPSVAYNWVATTGVPDFVEKIHVAARILHEKRKGVRPMEDDGDYQAGSSGGIPM